MIICKVCNRVFSTNRSLSHHIRAHNMTRKEYYDKYIKKENEGICIGCGKNTVFLNLTKGYRKFCSLLCCNHSDDHKQKMKNTIIERFGGFGTASSILNEKIKNTNIERYGAENVFASEYGKQQIKNACQEKYGVDHASQAEIVKQRIKHTSLERYNTSNPGNSPQGRLKAANTRRNSNNDSSWEDYFEKQLINLNINYKKRYYDIRYPYQCDFYLPDIDTFIEINGYWTHGKHWFNKDSIQDQKTLAIWQEKANQGHKQYQNAIGVWTIRDVEKYTIAKENKLKYIVLWTMNDIQVYIKSLSNMKG